MTLFLVGIERSSGRDRVSGDRSDDLSKVKLTDRMCIFLREKYLVGDETEKKRAAKLQLRFVFVLFLPPFYWWRALLQIEEGKRRGDEMQLLGEDGGEESGKDGKLCKMRWKEGEVRGR